MRVNTCWGPGVIDWRIHHKAETVSTNLDAREGVHGDVFTADYQTAGRGRLDHKWLSPEGTNLMMSAVLSVKGLAPERVATLPLVAGLAVVKAIATLIPHPSSPIPSLKWPNDVLVENKKLAGILCELSGDNVIVGIGVNVGQTEFDREIADRATSLALLSADAVFRLPSPVLSLRDAILHELASCYSLWREKGFAAVYPEIAAVDFLKGREIAVRQTDDDAAPLVGISNGIMPDGSLDVGGRKAYAGEAHVDMV